MHAFMMCSPCNKMLLMILKAAVFTLPYSYNCCHAFISSSPPPPYSISIIRRQSNTLKLQLQLSSSPSSSSIPTTIKATLTNNTPYSRNDAQQMIAQTLCPSNEERDRNLAIAGMEAYATSTTTNNSDDNSETSSNAAIGGDKAITKDDPRTEYTYDEFPLDSFDLLIDRALDFIITPLSLSTTSSSSSVTSLSSQDGDEYKIETKKKKTVVNNMVDLGSGCGRLCFYASLTRSPYWNVHGIEIGSQLHSLAVNSLQRGVDIGWWTTMNIDAAAAASSDGGTSSSSSSSIISQLAFHNGNALLTDDPFYKLPSSSSSSSSQDDTTNTNNIQDILSNANLIFAYSTVWSTSKVQPFNTDLGAMVLSSKWSKHLAQTCKGGCVAITTDRILNPEHGWKLVDRIDVENPSVWGSTGYISILEK